MTIQELERNDVEGALRLRRELISRGEWGRDTAEILLMLQDDPSELIRRIRDEDRKAQEK